MHADLKYPAGVEVPVPPTPEHLANASAHFLWGIRSGEPFTALCNPAICRDATAILDAGLVSSSSNSALVVTR